MRWRCRAGRSAQRLLPVRLAPGSAALAEHPKTVNLREDVLTGAINGWIGGLFSPENRDATVRAFVESHGGTASVANEGARTRLKDAGEALRGCRPRSSPGSIRRP
jgi:hypothetical protein